MTTAFPAETIVPIREYHGPCTLTLSKKSINIASPSRQEDLGTWPYDCIRKFHSQDLQIFSFTSGRRGPYGVSDYSFRLREIDLIQLQQVLSQNTGAKFEAPRTVRSHSTTSVSSRHSSFVSNSGSNHSPCPSPLPASPSQVTCNGYSSMRIGNGEPPNFARTNSPGTRPKSPGMSRDPSRVVSMSEVPRSPLVNHTQEDSSHDYLRYNPNSHSPKLARSQSQDHTHQTKESVPSSYDNHKLKSIPNGITPLPRTSPEAAQAPTISEDGEVVRRIKSPSPKEDCIDGPLRSPPLTKAEVKELKQYNKEPLINKSATIHAKRHTEYSEIDLPDTTSESSRPSSSYSVNSVFADQLYDVPRSTAADSSHYDTLPPPRPIVPDRTLQEPPKNHTHNPKRALPHLPTDYVNIDPNAANKFVGDDLYSVISDHVPSNVKLMSSTLPATPTTRHAPSTTMIRQVMSPGTIRPVLSPSTGIRPSPSPGTSMRPVPSPSVTRPLPSPNPATIMNGAKLFNELEEAGYEVFKSAPPTNRLPTCSMSSDMSDEYMEVTNRECPPQEDNQYIEIARNKPRTKNGYEMVDMVKSEPQPVETRRSPTFKDHEYVNVPTNGKSTPLTVATGNAFIMTTPPDSDQSITSMGTATPVDDTNSSRNDSDLEGPQDDVEQELLAINAADDDLYIPMHSVAPVDDTYVVMQSHRDVPVKDSMTTRGDGDLTTRTASIDLHSPQSLESSSPPNLTEVPHPDTPTILPMHQQLSLVPTAVGSPPVRQSFLARKRSLTIGDPLDIQEAKKHTYVNVPDDQLLSVGGPPRSKSAESPPLVDKPPMPLPKPEKSYSLDESTTVHNSTCNNNNKPKITTLIRQFSTGR